MAKTNDGFVIAEKDLELRGPGELLGTRQSGLPEFRVANIVRDQQFLEGARKEAEFYLAKGEKSPETAKMIERVTSGRALRSGGGGIEDHIRRLRRLHRFKGKEEPKVAMKHGPVSNSSLLHSASICVICVICG